MSICNNVQWMVRCGCRYVSVVIVYIVVATIPDSVLWSRFAGLLSSDISSETYYLKFLSSSIKLIGVKRPKKLLQPWPWFLKVKALDETEARLYPSFRRDATYISIISLCKLCTRATRTNHIWTCFIREYSKIPLADQMYPPLNGRQSPFWYWVPLPYHTALWTMHQMYIMGPSLPGYSSHQTYVFHNSFIAQ